MNLARLNALGEYLKDIPIKVKDQVEGPKGLKLKDRLSERTAVPFQLVELAKVETQSQNAHLKTVPSVRRHRLRT